MPDVCSDDKTEVMRKVAGADADDKPTNEAELASARTRVTGVVLMKKTSRRIESNDASDSNYYQRSSQSRRPTAAKSDEKNASLMHVYCNRFVT